MKITFKDIRWRHREDSDVFNIHGIKEISLDFESKEIYIKGVVGYIAPFCDFHYGGGISHFELTTLHPYEIDTYIQIAIFDSGVVAICSANKASVPAYFRTRYGGYNK